MPPKQKQRTTAKPAQNKPKAKSSSSKSNGPLERFGKEVGSLFGLRGLGGAAGSIVGKIIGSGDYQTDFANVQKNTFVTGGPPGFGGGANTTVITHREYVRDIFSTTTFSATVFPINPGEQKLFPWLSAIAQMYDEYEISGMIFEYKSTSTDSISSTNLALGQVVLATQYDPTKPPFSSKMEMENYEFCVSVKPSESVLHALECKKELSPVKVLYVRTGTNTSDLRWTDFGNFVIATTGQQTAGVQIGELWISYQIAFRKPRLPSQIATEVTSLFNVRSTTNFTSSIPFGITQVSNAGLLEASVSSTGVTLPSIASTRYCIAVTWNSSGAASFVAPSITTTDCDVIKQITSPPSGASTGGGSFIMFVVVKPSPLAAPTVLLNTGTGVAGASTTTITTIVSLLDNTTN